MGFTQVGAARILNAYKKGTKVMIVSPYVDGFARVYSKDDVVMISSQVWAEIPLTDLEFRLEFYNPIPSHEILEAHANPA